MTARPARPPAPGEGAFQRRVAEMLRVNHAGEYGATRIYAGQHAVFSRVPALRRVAEQMKRHETEEWVHRAAFERELAARRVRPTALEPFWNVAGFGLGVITALMGEKAAHACTAAVEEVIEEHYRAQEAELGDREPALKAMIADFREDEVGHKDEAIALGAKEVPAHPILEAAIKGACRVAIAVSQKV